VVKRQTVWLSTMMVLSLMLIGYYTMNNESGTPAANSSDTTSVVTPDANGGTNDSTDAAQQTAGSNANDTAANSNQNSSTKSTQSTAPSASDWYVEQQTKLKQDIERQIDTYSKVLTSSNASEDQLSQAEQQVNRLQSLEGGMDNAHDMIVAKGYKDCVIMPNKDYSKFTVYVKTDKLTAEQAVQIIHTVSEQLNISAINVNVTAQP
jgi:stage III sporulation protein AH